MQVMNYYKLSDYELDSKIEQIRQWLFKYPKDEKSKIAFFALEVALNAKEIRNNKVEEDIQEAIDILI